MLAPWPTTGPCPGPPRYKVPCRQCSPRHGVAADRPTAASLAFGGLSPTGRDRLQRGEKCATCAGRPPLSEVLRAQALNRTNARPRRGTRASLCRHSPLSRRTYLAARAQGYENVATASRLAPATRSPGLRPGATGPPGGAPRSPGLPLSATAGTTPQRIALAASAKMQLARSSMCRRPSVAPRTEALFLLLLVVVVGVVLVGSFFFVCVGLSCPPQRPPKDNSAIRRRKSCAATRKFYV